MKYSDEELLAILKIENDAAVGFDNASILVNERNRALEYYRGEMKDMAAPDNRSQAKSSDVADAIETAIPDLVEIFLGGDDVLAFAPVGEEDEDAAQQETDYLRHVIFQQNDGFLLLYTGIKDALTCKTGVWTWWWEKNEAVTSTKFAGKTAIEVQLASQSGEITEISQDGGTDEEPTYAFTLVNRKDRSCARIMAVPPEDFAVAEDTVSLGPETTYCAMRARPRAQDLIAEGVPKEKVDAIPSYYGDEGEQTRLARETVGEDEQPNDNAPGDLRRVEIRSHILRLVEEDKETWWRVRTDAECATLIDKQEVSGVNFAAITPYPIPHKFYGRSLADLLLELQRINTALTRTLLDSCYFAMNQRLVVNTDKASDFTISDLLRNEPDLRKSA